MVIEESDLSDNDERKPLVATKIKKQPVMSTHSNASNHSDEIDEVDLVEKCGFLKIHFL